ncbi:MAG: hypothetical protein ACKVQA_07000 [Burkholderiales bacterium]
MSEPTQAETQAQILDDFRSAMGYGQSDVGQALAAGSTALRAQVEAAPCAWTQDEIDGGWDGACGASWVFENEGPVENKMKFCPSCGKPLRLTALKAQE